MQDLPALKIAALRAIGFIRRRGFVSFLGRLVSVRSWLPALLTRRTPIEIPANDGNDLAGAIDPPTGGAISRGTGRIDGWAISRSDKIDKVQILVDGTAIGNASLCLPRRNIRSDSPEASICGFQIMLCPDQMPADADQIQVHFVVRTMSGETRVFPPRSMPLGPRVQSYPVPVSPNAAAVPRRRSDPSKKPKLACFTHSLSYGGAQLYLQELLRQFAARAEVDCVICSPQRGPLQSELRSLGFAVHIMQEPSTVSADRHDRATGAIGNWLLENEVDCVLANTLAGFYGVNAAAGVGLPSIWAIHESFPVSTWSAFHTQERPGSEFLLSRIESALRLSSAAIFESEATRRLFLQFDDGNRFRKVPYGIDISSIDSFVRGFDREQARDALGIPPGSRVLLCMGTIEPRKQQIFLAQAFIQLLAMHGEAVLLLVGDYPSDYSAALHRYLGGKNIGDRVRVVPITTVPYRWYDIADGFVLLSAIESMPRSIMEAMAFGLPVLASRVFGVPELIDDGQTGFLIEANSLRSATEGLNRLLTLSEAERNSISEAASRKIRLEHDARGYVDACRSLIRQMV